MSKRKFNNQVLLTKEQRDFVHSYCDEIREKLDKSLGTISKMGNPNVRVALATGFSLELVRQSVIAMVATYGQGDGLEAISHMVNESLSHVKKFL